jgi:IS30 family transposase
MSRPDVSTLKRNRAWHSVLTPYKPIIDRLRRKHLSYRKIAEHLRTKHQLSVSHNAIFSFVKARKRHILYALPDAMSAHPGHGQQQVSGSFQNGGATQSTSSTTVKIIGTDGKEIPYVLYEPADPNNL